MSWVRIRRLRLAERARVCVREDVGMISALAKPHAHAPRPPMKFKCVNYLYYAYIESINYGAGGLGDVDLRRE
jgi:hypothetical protein